MGKPSEGVDDLLKLFELAESYGIKDWLQFDASVVRGLSYYTGIVFEGFDKSGELRAICGGGRYDKLLESMGGDPLPAVGFGFGDAVIVELLKMKGCLPESLNQDIDAVIFPMTEKLRLNAIKVAKELRESGLKVDIVLENKKAKWVFQRADRVRAKVVVIIGEDEAINGEVVVKQLELGTQEKIKFENIVENVSQICKPAKI